jgi:hypothetical protein
MLYEEVNFNTFRERFRQIRPDNFSYEGLKALFDWLQEEAEDQNIALDVIGLCCYLTEYESVEAYNEDYYRNTIGSWDECNNVIVLTLTGGAIIQDH